jgi:CRISPR-associated exonuclease Cas4
MKDSELNQEDLLMISALQHYIFCPRQCALIHTEQAWGENRLTAEGRIMHERVHEAGNETRGTVRTARGLPLRSLRLGIVGMADMVEFHKEAQGRWRPFPVEYKRGKPKPDHSDAIQLCAQAICLEEMVGVEVSAGALYYGRTHHRHDVAFDAGLRAEVEKTVESVRALLESGRTPEPVYSKRCENCSIVAECLPKTIGKHKSAKRYLASALRDP